METIRALFFFNVSVIGSEALQEHDEFGPGFVHL